MPDLKEFNLQPNACEIAKLLGKIGDFLKSCYFTDDVIQSQKMILKELIKCGAKVGNLNPADNAITVFLNISENTIAMEVKSPVDIACNENLRKLDKVIQFIRGYQDPFEAYFLLASEVANHNYYKDVNGLELARIAYEGQAILDFYVSDENVLNQSAVRHITSRSE